MNKGIAVAGNLLADIIKIIDVFPKEGMLCNIKSQDLAVGGCVPNTIIDLAKIDSTLPLYAVGRVGYDDKGDYIKGKLSQHGINLDNLITDSETMTSFTDVMTVESTGARTFFHARGANAKFCFEDIHFDNLDCAIFHIGYALLLDSFDQLDEIYGTVLAKTLAEAQRRGFKTSIDVVSEHSDRFKRLVTPCLKYCDFIIINEIESSLVSGIAARDDKEKIIQGNLKKICRWFLESGVKSLVCLHFPEGGAAMNGKGDYEELGSLLLPKGYIKGAVGAGDAFCAGMLYSQYNGFDLVKSLKIASNTAACNLSASDSISGVKDLQTILNMDNIYSRRKEF